MRYKTLIKSNVKKKGVKNIALYDHALKDVKYKPVTGFLSCYLAITLIICLSI